MLMHMLYFGPPPDPQDLQTGRLVVRLLRLLRLLRLGRLLKLVRLLEILRLVRLVRLLRLLRLFQLFPSLQPLCILYSLLVGWLDVGGFSHTSALPRTPKTFRQEDF